MTKWYKLHIKGVSTPKEMLKRLIPFSFQKIVPYSRVVLPFLKAQGGKILNICHNAHALPN